MMTASESVGTCSLRCRSWGSQTGGGEPTATKLKKFQSFPSVDDKDKKPSTFNIRELMLPLTMVLQVQCPVRSRNDDATTTKVNEDNLDDTQPLRQLQPSQNAQQGSCLTNERTSDDTEDTSPPSCSHDEDGFGSREPMIQQQNLQQTRPNSALIYQRTSDGSEDTSPSDHRITIPSPENELDAMPPLTQQETSQNAHRRSKLAMLCVFITNLPCFLAFNRISDDDSIHTMMLHSAPVVLIAVLVLFGVLYFYHMIG